MTANTHLWLYFLVISGVIILPGLDMAFVMSSSVKGGVRAGFAAVAGTVVGGMLHMIIGATGLAAIFTLIPWAYTSMLIAGAGYIAWLGIGLLRASSMGGLALSTGNASIMQSFAGAFATCMLNPKAYVFMLAIFPQFIRPGSNSVWAQTSILSLITAATQIVVYGTLAIMTVRTQYALSNRPRVSAILAKSIGLILIAAAGLTLYSGLVRE
ncbi:LysE family translocator [Undibacterium sp. Ji22W]|uniref:LysE family translocator n=1 Tax=Undibacterium sp. Ji22W TaxID=3413038 RepID=UPI003BEFE61C